MAVSVDYYRNYNASDTTSGRWRSMSTYYEEPSIDYFSWIPPDGYAFKEWNTARDGSGTASHPGEEVTGSVRYAIWEQIPEPVPYLVTDVELASVADAIRAKGGTSAALEWPSGYVQAISDIQSGGGGMLVTFTEVNYAYTADKTFGEIAEALDSGIMPSVKFVSGNSSDHPAYAGISYFNIQNASYYAMKFTAFYTSTISGSPSSYPSWSSGN